MMDIYFVMTNYQLLECILHKMTINNDNKATILFSSFLVSHNPGILRDVEESGIFDRVAEFEETIFSYEKNVNMQDEIDAIADSVESKYGELFEKSNNIYVGQDVNSLGVYLVARKIQYYCLEDACGSYSNPEVLMSIIKDENKNRYNIIKKLKLGGRSKYVIKVYCDFDYQKEDFDPSSCVDFSVKKILKTLSKDELDKILRIYHCRRQKLDNKKKELLLTWHYNNMGFMTLDEQKVFFTLLVDYFKDGDSVLFIKPHPSDRGADYKKWFKDAIVFDRLMPSELLPFCIEDEFEKGITNWSTSIFGLREVLKNVVNFDKDIDKTYLDFHKYFAIVKYLDSIKNGHSVQRLILSNINKKQLYQLMRYYIIDYEKYYEFADKGEGINIANVYDESLEGKKCIILSGSVDFVPHGIIGITAGDTEDCLYLYNMRCENMFVEKNMKYSGYKLLISSRGLSEYIDYMNNELREKKNEMAITGAKKNEKIKELSEKVKNYRKQRDVLRSEVDGMLQSSSWKLTKPLRKLNSVRKK